MSAQFFPEVTKAWQEAAVDGDEIPFQKLLQAGSKFVPVFDRLGTVFTPVKADINGNLTKMTKCFEKAPADTIHKALVAEKAAGKTKDKDALCLSLLWFKRAMQFIFALMKKVAAGTEANAAAKEAYEETLSAYHGFMVKKTFQMGLMAAPGTDNLLKGLGSDAALTKTEMGEWVAAAEPILANIHAFLEKEGLDDKVKA
mmetsp:Transcript_35733/g.30041  ORF Transcript_35733/g.30041 Transcript_35733/m.30041 type:complete len:200 (+) Transcript_35733:29-628(+)